MKENLEELGGVDALERIARVPVYYYNYIGNAEDQIEIGPMAQDFHAEFPAAVDANDESQELRLSTKELVGATMAALRGAQQLIAEQAAQIAALEARLDAAGI